MLSPLLFNIFFAAIIVVLVSLLIERFSEHADILTNLVHLQEQPSRVGPETVLECARRATWRMFYAGDAYIVLRSSRGLELMMADSVKIFEAFGLNISESKT